MDLSRTTCGGTAISSCGHTRLHSSASRSHSQSLLHSLPWPCTCPDPNVFEREIAMHANHSIPFENPASAFARFYYENYGFDSCYPCRTVDLASTANNLIRQHPNCIPSYMLVTQQLLPHVNGDAHSAFRSCTSLHTHSCACTRLVFV